MDGRMERRNILISNDNESSSISIFRSRDTSEGSAKQLKNNQRSITENASVQALFQKGISIPRSRKNSLLREIYEETVARQVDTQEIKIKKQRKILDVKKVVEIKKKYSKTKLVISRKDDNFDEEQMLYKARTRLQQHYEQIKRILHDRDNYLYGLCFATRNLEQDQELVNINKSFMNLSVIKAAKFPASEAGKTSENTYGGKRVIVEDAVSDASLTNDYYDYTKAPQTERNILDNARRKASWANRRSYSPRASITSHINSHRASAVPGAANRSTAAMVSIISIPKSSSNHGDEHRRSTSSTIAKPWISLQPQTPRIDSQMARITSQVKASQARKVQGGGGAKDSFLGVGGDMKGVSGESKKTIQYMTSKHEIKNDSQNQSRRNVDSYIWYLIDPVAKLKYDIFLQKSGTVPNRSDSNEGYLSSKLQMRNN